MLYRFSMFAFGDFSAGIRNPDDDLSAVLRIVETLDIALFFKTVERVGNPRRRKSGEVLTTSGCPTGIGTPSYVQVAEKSPTDETMRRVAASST